MDDEGRPEKRATARHLARLLGTARLKNETRRRAEDKKWGAFFEYTGDSGTVTVTTPYGIIRVKSRLQDIEMGPSPDNMVDLAGLLKKPRNTI